MKELYKRLAATFAVSTFVIALLFTVSLYNRSTADSAHALEQLLESGAVNLRRAAQEQSERLELLKQDYLNRAWTVEYIAAHDYDSLTENGGLNVVRELLEVRGLSVLGPDGGILLSAGERPEEGPLPDALSSGRSAYQISAADNDSDGLPDRFFVLVKSSSDRFAAVRVDADASRLGLLSRQEMIRTTLRQATTANETCLAAVDRATGEIAGITENNRQEFSVRGIDAPQELADYLGAASSEDWQMMIVNGALCQAVVREFDDLYLVAYSEMNQVFSSAARTFLEGVLGIGAVSALTVLLFHYHLTRMERELSAARVEAQFDKLTGLYNRSGFERRALDFLAQDSPAGVLALFDLDNFKSINDSEGHPEGDRVLERFAACLTAAFRKSDCIGRLGGDEFIVLIPNAVPDAILEEKLGAVLADVRRALSEYRERYGVSVSIGAVPVDGTIRSYDALYKCADAALYIAKYMGKDRFYINHSRIVCSEEECAVYGEAIRRSEAADGQKGPSDEL